MDERIYCEHDNRIDHHYKCKLCESMRVTGKVNQITSHDGVAHNIPPLKMHRVRSRVKRMMSDERPNL